MTIKCRRYNRECTAPECIGLGTCWLEQLEAEQQQMAGMKTKMARMCPTLGIYCYLKQCVSVDKCDQIERAMTKVVDKQGNLGPIGTDKGDASAAKEVRDGAAATAASMGSAATGWKCPDDGQNCQMIACNGGQSCYVEDQRTKGYAMAHGHGYGSYKAVPPCHEGMNSLGFIKKAELMVGRETAAKGWDQTLDGKIGLIIGLLGDAYNQGNLVNMNDQAKSLGSTSLDVLTPVIPNIWIRWPDYGIVPFKRVWWEHLVSIIERVDGPVLMYCMGGHGRTGTAASIIGCLSGLIPEGADPVQWVRDNYCKKVVESEAQVKYIEEITGRQVHCFGAKTTSYNRWTTGGSSGHEKKKTAGSGVGGKRANKTKPDPNVLSKRQWKKWWHKVPHTEYPAIKNITRPGEIPDGQVFKIGAKSWRWNKKEDCFEKAL